MDIWRGSLAGFFYAGRGEDAWRFPQVWGRGEKASWVRKAVVLTSVKSTYLALCSLHTGAKAE